MDRARISSIRKRSARLAGDEHVDRRAFFRIGTAAGIGTLIGKGMASPANSAQTDPGQVPVIATVPRSRSVFEPRVPGGQWGNGAVGNARGTGVPLRDLPAKAGAKPGALEVSFRGLDAPILNTTPPLIKTISFDRASDGEVLTAYAMNDQPFPILNGFPCRLVVPGRYATYWVKALHEVTVLDKKFEGFWMDETSRIPLTRNYNGSAANLVEKTEPISVMTTRSLIIRPDPAEQVPAGAPFVVEGVAFDGGSGDCQGRRVDRRRSFVAGGVAR